MRSEPSDRRSVLAGGILIALVGCSEQATKASPIEDRGLDPRAVGVTFDGHTDDSSAWTRFFATIGRDGATIRCPPGRSLLRSTITPPPGTRMIGAGRDRTVFRITNSRSLPSLYGVSCRSGLSLADMTLEVENTIATPDGWSAGLGFVERAQNLRFERVGFRGLGRNGWAGTLIEADVTDVVFADCAYRSLDFAGILKSNSDPSHQARWSWLDCTGVNCVDGININSPAGSWIDGRIVGCDFSRTSQFPFALAGPRCAGWTLDVQGSDNAYELIHLEDGANRISIKARGERNNLRPGVAGSPLASNGFIQVIGGCHDVDVDVDVDLEQTDGVPRNAIVLQAGGPRVSDGREVPPFAIRLAGDVKVGQRGRAVVSHGGQIAFAGLTVTAASRTAADVVEINGSTPEGRFTLRTTPALR